MTPARGALYIATAGSLAIMARSVILEPLPMWVAGAALAGYVGLILCGVFILRLGMFVDVVWRGPVDARGVALTFDDGPSPATTPKVLDALDEAGVKATFFVIGRKVKLYPELVREIVARGHAVGVHGYDHDRLFSLRTPESIRLDLARAIEVITAATGQAPTLFRPPIGHTSPRIAGALEAFDFTVVGWSVKGLDGLAGARPERVAARIVPHLKDGAIVLLHDAAENEDFTPASVAALPKILAAMARKNLPGVRVDAWIDEAESAPDHDPDVVDGVGPDGGGEAAEGEDQRQEQAADAAERE
ncbi:MAG: polysaccharide deacetylase family protein [Byssovorax sp.]